MRSIYDRLENPTIAEAGVFLILWYLVSDWLFLDWMIVSAITSFARSYNSVITLAFTGALVVLYAWQSKTQRIQTEITQRQLEIQENQLQYERALNSPDLELQDIEIEGLGEGEGLYSDYRVIAYVHNVGQGRAKNLKLDLEFLFRMPDSQTFLPLHFIAITTMEADLIDLETVDSGSSLQYDPFKTLQNNDISGYAGILRIRMGPWTAPAEWDEGNSPGVMNSAHIPAEIVDNLGSCLQNFYFDVEEVMMKVKLKYEDASGTMHENIVDIRSIQATEDLTIEELAKEGTPRVEGRFTEGDESSILDEFNFGG